MLLLSTVDLQVYGSPNAPRAKLNRTAVLSKDDERSVEMHTTAKDENECMEDVGMAKIPVVGNVKFHRRAF